MSRHRRKSTALSNRIVISFDDVLYQAVLDQAIESGTTIAAEVRRLVEVACGEARIRKARRDAYEESNQEKAQ